MAAKPSSVPRWADVGGAIVEPSSGKKDIGWAAGERPPAQFFNWLLNLIYQWILYLSDGALDGNHSINGNLAVTGAITYTAVRTRPIHPSQFESAELTGAQTWAYVAVTSGGLVGSHLVSVTGTIETQASIPVDSGDRIHNVGVILDRTNTVTINVCQQPFAGGARTVLATQAVSATSGRQTVVLSGINHDCTNSSWYFIEIVSSDVSGDTIFGAYVDVSHPT